MTIKWDAGKPASVMTNFNEESTTETYTYGDDGLVIKIVSRYELGDEPEVIKTATVTYPQDAFDEKGNWIKRVVKYPDRTETQVREITYY